MSVDWNAIVSAASVLNYIDENKYSIEKPKYENKYILKIQIKHWFSKKSKFLKT